MVSAYSPRWHGREKSSVRPCDIPGCEEAGEYRAPKSRNSSEFGDYHWFCLNHVTEYNKSWNYFEGMSEMELERYWQDAPHGHRKTWKRDGMAFDPRKLSEAVQRGFADYFTDGEMDPEIARQRIQLNQETKKALAILDLNWPITAEEVKTQFKKLVKQYHPDVNKRPDAEDRFKAITEAYGLLMTSLKNNVD
jgi:hypothetical protein